MKPKYALQNFVMTEVQELGSLVSKNINPICRTSARPQWFHPDLLDLKKK